MLRRGDIIWTKEILGDLFKVMHKVAHIIEVVMTTHALLLP